MAVTSPILPIEKVGTITTQARTTWLIESLWLENACGIIGGQPKVCKSWLGLEMIVSVASGTPCLGHFPVTEKGPALVFMAEDRVDEVRNRVEHLTLHRGIALESLDLYVITAPVVRLDSEDDCARLNATIDALKPKILLLDPLVRLHRCDENSAREISGLLGFLRELERRHHVAIVLTHHASKRAHSRPGQGLRGSSDLHAFGDSNIYLSRKSDDIELTVEHRSASSIDPLQLKFVNHPYLHLEVQGKSTANLAEPTLESKVIGVLQKSVTPVSRSNLRDQLRVNNQKLGQTLQVLSEQRIVYIQDGGYRMVM